MAVSSSLMNLVVEKPGIGKRPHECSSGGGAGSVVPTSVFDLRTLGDLIVGLQPAVADRKGRVMSAVSRRSFLRGGSLTVMAAGVVSAVPGLSSLLTTAATDAPSADGAAAGVVDGSSLGSELVAHVRDFGSGEIAVYHGTEEFVFHDLGMAAQLFRATR